MSKTQEIFACLTTGSQFCRGMYIQLTLYIGEFYIVEFLHLYFTNLSKYNMFLEQPYGNDNKQTVEY